MAGNIVITGFTSSGKSVTGKLVARKLSYEFIDLDSVVESRYARSYGSEHTCREIFALHGHAWFSALEVGALETVQARENIVLSPGGGVLHSTEARAMLKRIGTIFYLATEPGIIFKRMTENRFPVYLRGDHSYENVLHHWKKRKRVYEETCRYRIDNSHLTPEQTADAVILLWNTHIGTGEV